MFKATLLQTSGCFCVGGEGLNGKGYKRTFCVNGNVLYIYGFRVNTQFVKSQEMFV